MTGFAFAQEQTSAPATSTEVAAPEPNSCCAASESKSTCTIDKPCISEKCSSKKSCHDVLTKEERHCFCVAKAAAIAANPSLGGKGHKKELCETICKENPSMKPIVEKLKKHYEEMHKKLKKAPSAPVS